MRQDEVPNVVCGIMSLKPLRKAYTGSAKYNFITTRIESVVSNEEIHEKQRCSLSVNTAIGCVVPCIDEPEDMFRSVASTISLVFLVLLI